MQQLQAAGLTVPLLLSCSQYEYLWADGVKFKKPVRLSAPEYVDKLFDWIEDQVRCSCRGQQDTMGGSQYSSTGGSLWGRSDSS
jgi:hypothetical protein